MAKIEDHKTVLSSEVNDQIKEALKDAHQNGKDESYSDLNQKLEGLQGRVDRVNVSNTQAERLASADHSKIRQLDQVSRQSIEVVNDNSRTEEQLISQLKEPLEFSGAELLKALEESAGTTVNKLISKRTIQSLLKIQKKIEFDKNEVKESEKEMKAQIQEFKNWILAVFVTGTVMFITPLVWMKVLVFILGIVGGIIYDKLK